MSLSFETNKNVRSRTIEYLFGSIYIISAGSFYTNYRIMSMVFHATYSGTQKRVNHGAMFNCMISSEKYTYFDGNIKVVVSLRISPIGNSMYIISIADQIANLVIHYRATVITRISIIISLKMA